MHTGDHPISAALLSCSTSAHLVQLREQCSLWLTAASCKQQMGVQEMRTCGSCKQQMGMQDA